MSEVDLGMLKEAGLTEYEAKSYIELLRYGTMQGSEVAEKSEVPKTRVYDALKSLSEKGLASKIQERPMKFSPIEPKKGLKPLYERKKNRIEHIEEQVMVSLEEIDEIGERKEVQQKIDVIYGHQNMFSHMMERFEDATDEIFGLVVGRVPRKNYQIKLKKMIDRGVDFRIITSKYDSENREMYDKMNQIANVRYNDKDLQYVIVVKDRETAMINVLNPDVEEDRISVFFEVEGLSKALSDYLETMWENSTPLEQVTR